MVGGGIVFIGFKAGKSETHGTYKSFPLNLKDGLRINCLLNDFSRRVENTPDGLLYIQNKHYKTLLGIYFAIYASKYKTYIKRLQIDLSEEVGEARSLDRQAVLA